MTRYKAGVSSCLTRALKLFRRSEFTCDDRSGLETDARDRVQQRAPILQLRIFLDVFFDFFLQILNLAFNFFKETAVRTTNRFILSLIQPARAFGFSLSGGPVGSA